jgi:hypothetical protein
MSLLLLPASTADAGEGPRSREISQNGSIVVDTPLKLKINHWKHSWNTQRPKKSVQSSPLKIIYFRTITT